MAQEKNLLLYTAEYDDVTAALDDLRAVEQLHKDELIGSYDAAVIDKENGKPHIVKRMDRPRIRVIPEAFGGGRLPRKELKDAAQELTAKVVKHTVDATTDQIASELQEALKE